MEYEGCSTYTVDEGLIHPMYVMRKPPMLAPVYTTYVISYLIIVTICAVRTEEHNRQEAGGEMSYHGPLL